jgi:2-polyprenyl-3-methyl-5-hydroxy-6-metoxy-1,4-benzoquinol methylase
LLTRNGKAPDYFPERWIPFEHEGKKLDLKDVTFTIPVYRDHNDRSQNLQLSVCMLQRDVDTNIIVGEQGSNGFGHFGQWCTYRHFTETDSFHRTRMLNQMCMSAETPIVVNWDADIVVPPLQLWLAAEAIRNGDDMVYPYDGRFARVPREKWFKPMEKALDIGVFGRTEFKGKNGNPLPVSSVGGAVFVNKESFIDAGMENENMISYGPEDCERYDRFNCLGFRVKRIKGCLYHFDHYIGENSSSKLNPFGQRNKEELFKIRELIEAGRQKLRAYVDSWEWVDKYTEGYYSEISGGSTRSRDAIFKILQKHHSFKSVIDVGCGIGEWGIGIEQFGVTNYRGVDYRVPKKKLLINPDQYAEYDLRTSKPFPFDGKFELVICVEVAEHLEERYADQIVKTLTSLGKTILFSAAIPNQGGKGHVNEQWQDYWAAKFRQYDYHPEVIEDIRWNTEIEVWYRQNAIVYSKGCPNPSLIHEVKPFVHPEMFMNVVSSLKSA